MLAVPLGWGCARVSQGFNLFNPRHESQAWLMDNDGEIVYRWSSPARGDTFLRFRASLPTAMPGYMDGWNHFRLLEQGDLLVSVRSLDLVVDLDHESGRAVWGWGRRELQGAHHATHLSNGNILIFDNGARRGYSRTLEVLGRGGGRHPARL